MVGSFKKMMNKLSGRSADNLDVIQDLIKQIEKAGLNNIAVYGSGDIGRLFSEHAPAELNIEFFIDAKARFDSMTVNEKPVYSLMQAKNRLLDIEAVVIASFKFREEMSAMLLDFVDDPSAINVIKY